MTENSANLLTEFKISITDNFQKQTMNSVATVLVAQLNFTAWHGHLGLTSPCVKDIFIVTIIHAIRPVQGEYIFANLRFSIPNSCQNIQFMVFPTENS